MLRLRLLGVWRGGRTLSNFLWPNNGGFQRLKTDLVRPASREAFMAREAGENGRPGASHELQGSCIRFQSHKSDYEGIHRAC
jgi:hypothetical protein